MDRQYPIKVRVFICSSWTSEYVINSQEEYDSFRDVADKEKIYYIAYYHEKDNPKLIEFSSDSQIDNSTAGVS